MIKVGFFIILLILMLGLIFQRKKDMLDWIFVKKTGEKA